MHIRTLASFPFLAILSLTGCDRSLTTNASHSMKRLPIAPVPTFTGVVSTDAPQRDAQEAAAKARLLALLEEPMRAFVKARLESPDLNTQVSITGIPGNPEAAAVLGEIYAIKEARHADAYLSEQQ